MNGVVTLTQIRNTLADLLAVGGIRNADRYYHANDEEIEQQMLMQQATTSTTTTARAAANPMAMAMQAEAMKTQTNAQVDMQKAAMDNQYKMHKLAMER